MPRDWLTEEEEAQARKDAKWFRIEVWETAFFCAALAMIVLKSAFL